MSVFNHDMGTGRPWVARFRVIRSYVPARGADGRIRQCYKGACLDWLSPIEEAHFLRMGLVERIPEAEQAAVPADARQVGIESDEDAPAVPDNVNSDILDECGRDLERLLLQPDCGAPTARKALREAGLHYGNDVIAAAVRARKAALAESITK